MNCLYHAYVSNNPAGIDINLGYYALAECILTKTNASAALLRWCGLWFDKNRQKPAFEKNEKQKKLGAKTRKILRIYEKNPKITNRKIAQLVHCTPEMVGIVLHKIGVRRNRWDGYISKDPRYSKNKRGKCKNEYE